MGGAFAQAGSTRMMKAIKQTVGFLRWRLIPVRYAGKVWRSLPGIAPAIPPARSPIVAQVEQTGWAEAAPISPEVLERLRTKYFARADAVIPRQGGHPFTSLFRAEDIGPDDPLCQLAFSRGLLDTVHDYFRGRFRFDSIQLMYSWPTNGSLAESQLWHRDYGDANSFHWIAYLDDLLDDAGGPFTFVDREATRKIGRSMVIRRIGDEDFERELGDGVVHRFYGRAGEGIYVDPSICYHYGSRCRRPRLAIFVTFSTDRPFTNATDLIVRERERLVETACAIRPDLNRDYVRTVLAA